MEKTETTYELKIVFNTKAPVAAKQILMTWFRQEGVTSFVEGALDDVDQLQSANEDLSQRPVKEIESNSPLYIYSYDKDYLEGLKIKLLSQINPGILQCFVGSMTTKSWQLDWQKNFEPVVSERFVVLAPWHDRKNFQDKEHVIIEPGLAFGTGQHETTQLCLEAIEKLELPIRSVLDVGTGSGVLAIAAEKTFSCPVDAIDIDRDAVIASQKNANINNCSHINIWQDGVPFASKKSDVSTYDLILANILCPVLLEMLPHLFRLLTPGGKLVMSGVLSDEQEILLEKAVSVGLKFVAVEQRNAWIAAYFEKVD